MERQIKLELMLKIRKQLFLLKKNRKKNSGKSVYIHRIPIIENFYLNCIIMESGQ